MLKKQFFSALIRFLQPKYLIAFVVLAHQNALAQTSSTIVQPIGTVVQEWNPALVNQYLEKWDTNIIPGVTDPFDTRYAVSEVQPTQPMYFVRVYTEPNSGPLGSYIVRASVIRGLTPQQIRNILALPEVPTKMVYVKVPAGAQYGLWTGIAGPIMSQGYEWGQGGGEQTKIIGKETNSNPPPDPARFANYSRLPAASYMNAQFIGNKALSYSEYVTSGNAGKVARYLDKSLPAPYSDLEMVYATLDYINADGPPQLAMALNQMSPIDFNTYPIVLFRNDILFSNTLFMHPQMGYGNKSNQPKSISGKNQSCFVPWVTIAGEQGEESQGDNRIGFYYQTSALMGGAECLMSPTFKWGVGAGYFRNHLGWNMSAGNATLENAKLALYSSYTESDYFFNSALTGGFDWGSADRNLNFMGNGIAVVSGLISDTLSVNRTASSNPTGQNLGLTFTGGTHLHYNQWNFTPNAQLSYFYSRTGAFNESGAASLNLHVNDFTNQTIRSQLSMMLNRNFTTQQGREIKADLLLGWAHYFPLDNRVITANLPALGGEFNVQSYNQDSNSAVVGAGITANISKKCWIDGQYYAELSKGFNSQALSLILKYYLDA